MTDIVEGRRSDFSYREKPAIYQIAQQHNEHLNIYSEVERSRLYIFRLPQYRVRYGLIRDDN